MTTQREVSHSFSQSIQGTIGILPYSTIWLLPFISLPIHYTVIQSSSSPLSSSSSTRLDLLDHSDPSVSWSGPSISSMVLLQHFPWGKSVTEISPWKVTGLLMGESSGRAANLLHLDLHDNFLSYHPLKEQSSLSLQLHLATCMTTMLLPSLAWDTDIASFYYTK
jgi:hypothetical protein